MGTHSPYILKRLSDALFQDVSEFSQSSCKSCLEHSNGRCPECDYITLRDFCKQEL